MRTLISLVLIWSLAQLAWAVLTPTKVDPGNCKTLYDCYVPEKCKYPSITLEDSKIIVLDGTDKIFDDCEAIIRFHHYSKKSVYVSISSFQESGDIKSIIFSQMRNDGKIKNEFSCSIDKDGKIRGRYVSNVDKQINSVRYQKDNTPGKLMCEFPYKKKYGNDFFDGKAGDKVIITLNKDETDPGKTIKKDLTINHKVKCDPSFLYYNEEDDSKKPGKLYEEVVVYSPGNYDCPEKYTLEYRKTRTEEYQSGIVLNCNEIIFEVRDPAKPSDPPLHKVQADGDDGSPTDTIDIRCVADVKYFCDYSVQRMEGKEHPTTKSPVFEPNGATNRATELKCPGSKPHLIIVRGGREEPIMNVEPFKCVKDGPQQLWVVSDTRNNMEIKITKNGPMVYCSETVKCNQFFTLPDNAVNGGFVSDNFMPECYDNTGTLKSGEKEVTNPRCDGKTGKFMYTVGGEEKAMDRNTKFECTYPPEVDEAEQKNEENAKLLTNGIISALAVGIATVLLGIGAFAFFTIRRKRKNEKKLKDDIYAEQLQYGTKSLKEAAQKATNKNKDKKKGSKSSTKTDSATDTIETWNAMVTSANSAYAAAAFKNGDAGSYINNKFANLAEKTVPTTYQAERVNNKSVLAVSKKVAKKEDDKKKETIEEIKEKERQKQEKRKTMTPEQLVLADVDDLWGEIVLTGYDERDKKLGKKKDKKEKSKK